MASTRGSDAAQGLLLGPLLVLLGALERLARLLGLELAVPHGGEHAPAPEEFRVRAALDDDALVEHDDLVGADHRREAVRDDEGGAAAAHPVEGVLDLLL